MRARIDAVTGGRSRSISATRRWPKSLPLHLNRKGNWLLCSCDLQAQLTLRMSTSNFRTSGPAGVSPTSHLASWSLCMGTRNGQAKLTDVKLDLHVWMFLLYENLDILAFIRYPPETVVMSRAHRPEFQDHQSSHPPRPKQDPVVLPHIEARITTKTISRQTSDSPILPQMMVRNLLRQLL